MAYCAKASNGDAPCQASEPCYGTCSWCNNADKVCFGGDSISSESMTVQECAKRSGQMAHSPKCNPCGTLGTVWSAKYQMCVCPLDVDCKEVSPVIIKKNGPCAVGELRYGVCHYCKDGGICKAGGAKIMAGYMSGSKCAALNGQMTFDSVCGPAACEESEMAWNGSLRLCFCPVDEECGPPPVDPMGACKQKSCSADKKCTGRCAYCPPGLDNCWSFDVGGKLKPGSAQPYTDERVSLGECAKLHGQIVAGKYPYDPLKTLSNWDVSCDSCVGQEGTIDAGTSATMDSATGMCLCPTLKPPGSSYSEDPWKFCSSPVGADPQNLCPTCSIAEKTVCFGTCTTCTASNSEDCLTGGDAQSSKTQFGSAEKCISGQITDGAQCCAAEVPKWDSMQSFKGVGWELCAKGCNDEEGWPDYPAACEGKCGANKCVSLCFIDASSLAPEGAQEGWALMTKAECDCRRGVFSGAELYPPQTWPDSNAYFLPACVTAASDFVTNNKDYQILTAGYDSYCCRSNQLPLGWSVHSKIEGTDQLVDGALIGAVSGLIPKGPWNPEHQVYESYWLPGMGDPTIGVKTPFGTEITPEYYGAVGTPSTFSAWYDWPDGKSVDWKTGCMPAKCPETVWGPRFGAEIYAPYLSLEGSLNKKLSIAPFGGTSMTHRAVQLYDIINGACYFNDYSVMIQLCPLELYYP